MGLETKPKYANIDVIEFFLVSFNPLAVKYIFNQSISDILNSGKQLPDNFFDFAFKDLNDFDAFYEKISKKIQVLLPKEVDERKLFEWIFKTHCEISVKKLSEKISWSER